jgi:hypothetical protein
MPADENALSASIDVGGIVFRALKQFFQIFWSLFSSLKQSHFFFDNFFSLSSKSSSTSVGSQFVARF